MLAVIPVRDGVLPAGGAEVAAECGDRSLVIGSRARASAGLRGTVHVADVGHFQPVAWAAAIAAVIRDAAGQLADPIVLLPASPDGRDLAPRIAAELDIPLLAGAMSVSPSTVVLA